LTHALRHADYYMVSADFEDYFRTQRAVDRLWQSPGDWTRMSIFNVVNMTWFFSDRTIREYAQEIWHVPVEAPANSTGDRGAEFGAMLLTRPGIRCWKH